MKRAAATAKFLGTDLLGRDILRIGAAKNAVDPSFVRAVPTDFKRTFISTGLGDMALGVGFLISGRECA
ncbi:MAG: hypothetical protein ACLQD8_05430 [Thermoplasmata archaeon]